ncbi:hypothetical protein KTO58_15150 [Chitinophaga pendula]|uniref:hypothetical protein n=1 Tax=Chitinophaga TaxID=79328 RepID=UPI000BAE7DF2|nr:MULTISPECIES: hypothetical protein [Chitinophaga]ASZ11937.1 hypothetical protein CK934_13700 [Chitinophaga sp. MD30]UCJ05034.1 hypothetical protein KTO58_15150 [Chitinophaga pendula]
MIKELVNFTSLLDDSFKMQNTYPKEGLHIRLKIKEINQQVSIDLSDIQHERFSKKAKDDVSSFLHQCKLLQQQAWCIDTNKCFDLPTKAIHTCSPFAVGFKREHWAGGSKYQKNTGTKNALSARFGVYFGKAFELFVPPEIAAQYVPFRDFFLQGHYSAIIEKIEQDNKTHSISLQEQIAAINEEAKQTKEKSEKEKAKEQVAELTKASYKYMPLEEGNYIIFYLDVTLSQYQEVYDRYLNNALFNSAKYNVTSDEGGPVFGTSNFMNSYNSTMPFLLHHTAPFEISGRISEGDARLLHDLKNIFPNKTLPNPLPVFVYQEELQQEVISIYQESEFKFGYREIIERVTEKHASDVSNYYLLLWQNTKDGLVFKDFDFVSRFEYQLASPVVIQNLFGAKVNEGKAFKHYSIIKDIFSLEQQVFKPLLQNEYHRLDYFGELSKDGYTSTDRVFHSYCRYRKVVYDYVYKSHRHFIDGRMFDDMVFGAILDDIKNDKDDGVKDKLNIWYGAYHLFHNENETKMSNMVPVFRAFVNDLISGNIPDNIQDEEFAFAAGQVIDYMLSKSKSSKKNRALLEPYLQHSKCLEFQKAISNDMFRYKHGEFSDDFETVASVVLGHRTDINMKDLLPSILSGVFSKNQL